MQNLSVRRKIVAGFGAILLVLVAICAFGFGATHWIEKRAATTRHDTLPGLVLAGQIKDAIQDDLMFSPRIRDSQGAARAAVQAEQAANRAKLESLLTEYEKRVVTPRDRELLGSLRRTFTDYRATADNAGMVGQMTAADRMRIMSTFEASMATARLMMEENSRHTIEAIDEIDLALTAQKRAFLLSIVVALAIAAAAAVMLIRSITRPLAQLGALMDTMRQGDFTQRMTINRRDEFGVLGEGFNRMADEVMRLVGQVQKSGIRVSTSMTEIAATSKQQQATATEVAATATEIGATSREISATSRELVRTMNEVSSVAENAAELASTGQSGLAQMAATMGQVMEAGASINTKLAVLNEKAGNINQIVTTITKVADQINLLSLNAAIEAEKAGEYGRGFAVVSSEIRRLADQTAVATFDIEETVKEIQSAVSAGVMGMDKFAAQVRRGIDDVQEIGGNLSQVIQLVQTLAPRFEAVNEGMETQAAGAEQISEALLQLTDATQQTVESLRQSSSAIDDLSQVSGALHSSIARFKLADA